MNVHPPRRTLLQRVSFLTLVFALLLSHVVTPQPVAAASMAAPAAALTLVSMISYLRAAWPEMRER